MSGIGGVVHEERVALLASLADLIGATTDLRRLPDGSVPDVVRLAFDSGLLFVGEAKDTEYPGASEVRARLARYLMWATAHAQMGHVSVLAICCRRAESSRWSAALAWLVGDSGCGRYREWVRPMGDTTALVTAVFEPPGSSLADGGTPGLDEFEDAGAVLVDSAHP